MNKAVYKTIPRGGGCHEDFDPGHFIDKFADTVAVLIRLNWFNLYDRIGENSNVAKRWHFVNFYLFNGSKISGRRVCCPLERVPTQIYKIQKTPTKLKKIWSIVKGRPSDLPKGSLYELETWWGYKFDNWDGCRPVKLRNCFYLEKNCGDKTNLRIYFLIEKVVKNMKFFVEGISSRGKKRVKLKIYRSWHISVVI